MQSLPVPQDSSVIISEADIREREGLGLGGKYYPFRALGRSSQVLSAQDLTSDAKVCICLS